MYLYNRQMRDKIRFEFNGIEKIDQTYSQCLQDLLVLSILDGKVGGSFLEIGGFHPSFLSNTYLLETKFSWSGWSIDIDKNLAGSFRRDRPMTEFIGEDALKVDYYDVLKDYLRVDYLSLDIEPSYQTLACLKKLPLHDVRFSVITYETDVYDPLTPKEESERIRQESRDILRDYGYVMIAGNISNLTDDAPFEDWYVDGTFFNKNLIKKFKRIDDTPVASHKYVLKEN